MLHAETYVIPYLLMQYYISCQNSLQAKALQRLLDSIFDLNKGRVWGIAHDHEDIPVHVFFKGATHMSKWVIGEHLLVAPYLDLNCRRGIEGCADVWVARW